MRHAKGQIWGQIIACVCAGLHVVARMRMCDEICNSLMRSVIRDYWGIWIIWHVTTIHISFLTRYLFHVSNTNLPFLWKIWTTSLSQSINPSFHGIIFSLHMHVYNYVYIYRNIFKVKTPQTFHNYITYREVWGQPGYQVSHWYGYPYFHTFWDGACIGVQPHEQDSHDWVMV